MWHKTLGIEWSMKKLLIILIIILFHQFANGYWIVGWAVSGSTSIALDSNGWCTKFTGEVNECTISELYLLNNLKILYDEE